MKKFLYKLSALVIGISFMLLPLTGCTKEDVANTLYIDISNAGYGINWLNPLVDIFEEENPSITVKIRSVVKNDGNYVNKALSGVADTDLFFVETNVLKHVDAPLISGDGTRYETPFADLTTLFNEKIPGEEVTIAEKMRPEYLAYNTLNGKNYTFPWMESMMGIVMNKNVYRESWGKLPNTTDELFKFCNKVKADGVSPFIFSTADPYWLDIYDIWMSQYHGLENMARFYDGYTLSGEYAGERYNPDMFLDEGLWQALSVLGELLNFDNGYHNNLSYTLSFTDVQNKFLDANRNSSASDQILFMVNGAWLQREMEMNYTADEINSEFIRTPVVSALGTKLGITDAELSAIIDYVDGTIASAPQFTSSKSIPSEDVISEVAAARKIVSSNHLHAAFIPVYSTKQDLARKFIQLMASDKGIKAMLEESQLKPPMLYDALNAELENPLSSFMRSTYAIADNSVFNIVPQGDLFRIGGLELVNNQGYFTSYLSAKNPVDRKSAEDIFTENYNYVSDNTRWNYFLSSAGISLT